jgi:hypothetical protein
MSETVLDRLYAEGQCTSEGSQQDFFSPEGSGSEANQERAVREGRAKKYVVAAPLENFA